MVGGFVSKFSNQLNNKQIIEDCNEKLRSKLCELEKKPLFIEMAVYFKELNFQLNSMSFDNDWKTYYYEFGILFALIDIFKEYSKIGNPNFKKEQLSVIFNFEFEKYIKFDLNQDVNYYFRDYEDFITALRCLIIAHPINSSIWQDKTVYYSLNQIWIDEDSEIRKVLLKDRVSGKKDFIRLEVQRYTLNDRESTEDLFSFIISNRFFGNYYKFISDILLEKLSKLPSEDELEKSNENTLKNILLDQNKNLKQKLAEIKKYEQKLYACDIEYGHIPFDVKYIDALLKNYNPEIAQKIIKTVIKNIDIDYGVDCFDLHAFEDQSKDYKYTIYWFENVNLLEKVDWKNIEDLAINYSMQIDNERFVYFYSRFLFNVLTPEEVVSCVTYLELLNKIINKNEELNELVKK